MNSFIIHKAKDRGYYVMINNGRGVYNEILCCGTLGECLNYIQKQFDPPVNTPVQ